MTSGDLEPAGPGPDTGPIELELTEVDAADLVPPPPERGNIFRVFTRRWTSHTLYGLFMCPRCGCLVPTPAAKQLHDEFFHLGGDGSREALLTRLADLRAELESVQADAEQAGY